MLVRVIIDTGNKRSKTAPNIHKFGGARVSPVRAENPGLVENHFAVGSRMRGFGAASPSFWPLFLWYFCRPLARFWCGRSVCFVHDPSIFGVIWRQTEMDIIDKVKGSTDEQEPHPGNPFIAGDPSSNSDRDEDTQAREDANNAHDVEEEKESILPKLGLPIALLVGAAIMGGGTYAVVAYVQNLVANAAVDNDEAKWIRLARTDAYDGCYLGCTSCDDPNFAYNACQLTTRVDVKGVICNANKMWNWAVEDRYPKECLKAVSKVIMGDALEDLKNHYRKRYAIITVAIVGGLAVGFLVYFLWRKFAKPKETPKPWSTYDQTPAPFSIKRPATWKLPKKEKPEKTKTEHTDKITTTTTTTPTTYEPTNLAPHGAVATVPIVSPSRSSSRSSCSSRASSTHSAQRIPTPPTFDLPRPSSSRVSSCSSSSSPRLSTLIGAALTITTSGASASICIRDQPWTQHFITSSPSLTQKTITGTIHGWFSECYQIQKCKQKCRWSCSGSSCGNKCSKECHMEDRTKKEPKVFVDAVVPMVAKCGFKMVDTLSGSETPTVRVANGGIERGLYSGGVQRGFDGI
ncbi:LOW QUALITY PROTEIN: hypothetical protein QC761_401255 [Podospora bellae-mahoneyi]|uniref:Uncharacterized protein n=1 Tax=Podospora bellae-mahoneyi TaxID=2093777 RepID=A0ABR0FII4_9PEZI|nr:LOW QUALITY PROTEIN: hypothetical protein QC761_401255 [Podospora bellae-mahoneyi]